MSTIELTEFELRDLPPGEGSPIELTHDASGPWLPAAVPGGVHEALMAAGRLVDPLLGDHEPDAAWIEGRDWWFRTRFRAPARTGRERVRLIFDGLDTIADVWLDGTLLGHHENQFAPVCFDVTARLESDADETHVLLVRFAPPIPADAEQASGTGPRGPLQLVRHLRKAAFSWGWDFAPRVPSIGVWRPARLALERGAAITGHHVGLTGLAADHSAAVVRMSVDVDVFAATTSTAAFTLTAPDGRELRAAATVADGAASVELDLDHPALWWTHDLGDQPLHQVRIDLHADGALVDARDDRVGLRTIAVDRSPEPVEGGRLFQFVLNGVPLFARGANWVPPSPFVGSADPGLLRDRVLLARQGNLTMLRVWGGGVYEHDAFYGACDELGVLVWQDFMFACVDYPGEDATFRAEVDAEARAQVARLRNRACLAVWCGNNEVEIIHLLTNGGREAGDWGRRIFHEVLPRAVAEIDGLVSYWPGSPWGEGGPHGVNGVLDGDRHDWEVWHGLVIPGFTHGSDSYPTRGDARHYRRYADDTARFASEFGIMSAPDRGTLDRWLPGIALHDTTFERHITDRPVTKLDELFAVTTGIPGDLDEYVALSQAVQAEAMTFAVEHFRRRQPRTAGALVWQFNDTWPAMTWSLVDVDGVPKAAYHALARASAPLVVSFMPTADDGLQLWLVNNTRLPARVRVDVELGTFDGLERDIMCVTGTAETATSAVIWTGRVSRDARHYAWAASPDGAFPPARRHFAELGDLELGDGRVDVTVVHGGVDLVSHGYSYGVRISHPEPAMRLDDNHFDLRNGERRFVGIHGVDPATVTVTTTTPHSRASRERTV